MRYIISTEIDNIYKGYKVVPSFENLSNCDDIECIILHEAEENELKVGMCISELWKAGVTKFVYVNSNPLISIKTVIIGVNGHTFEDEFYFESEEELDGLLEMLGMSCSEELLDTSISTISDFIRAFVRKEERINTPVYIDSVQSAISTLIETNNQLVLEKKDMGMSAVNTFEQVKRVIESMDAQQKKLTKQLNELQDLVKDSSPTPRSSFGVGGSVISYFPTVSYMGRSKVLLVREYSPCRYLTSMILAYRGYLDYKGKRVKVVFVHARGQGTALKYSEFTTISQESLSNESLYSSDIVATNTPKREVMNKLLSKGDDVVIVVDRLYGSQDILSGRVVKVNAVSGLSDLKRFNLSPKNTIFPVTAHPEGFITLPVIQRFPIDRDMRYTAYQSNCVEDFRKLDKLLGLEV